ncbi:MAG: hypothetical protein L0332_33950 [Chloroflexi bacterium]|nr:hypothetical protein [Chloroflexota bacterium]MCI0574619.1 hypothetical protein [Chloroflexota bacterium]MCI0644029.1 hypothetical protein [Chloroflexota bacterium]MCI0731703.1 hypothetical protein [Chloroflexota bacterium]
MASQLFNPFDNPDEQLKQKALLHMKKELVNEKMMALTQDAYAEFLRRETIVVTRNEKRSLFRAMLKEMFDDMLANL